MDAYQLCEKKFMHGIVIVGIGKSSAKKILSLLKFSQSNCELILSIAVIYFAVYDDGTFMFVDTDKLRASMY